MPLLPHQVFLYHLRLDIWRKAEVKTGTKLTGFTWSRVAAAVPAYLWAGDSVKNAFDPGLRVEADNMDVLERFQVAPETDLKTMDYVYVTAGGALAGEWYQTEGEAIVRDLLANTLTIRAARMDPPPELAAAAGV